MTQILDVTTSEDVCTRQRTKVLHYFLPDTNNGLLKSNLFSSFFSLKKVAASLNQFFVLLDS